MPREERENRNRRRTERETAVQEKEGGLIVIVGWEVVVETAQEW